MENFQVTIYQRSQILQLINRYFDVVSSIMMIFIMKIRWFLSRLDFGRSSSPIPEQWMKSNPAYLYHMQDRKLWHFQIPLSYWLCLQYSSNTTSLPRGFICSSLLACCKNYTWDFKLSCESKQLQVKSICIYVHKETFPGQWPLNSNHPYVVS